MTDQNKGFQMPFIQQEDEIWLRASDCVAFLETLEDTAIECENMDALKVLRCVKGDFQKLATHRVQPGAEQQLRVIDIEEGTDDQAGT